MCVNGVLLRSAWMGLCADVSRNHQIVDSILELYIASILEKLSIILQ